MTSIPPLVTDTCLWKRLSEDDLLAHAVTQLRTNALAVGAKIAELIPGFTDHSISHMDALWGVTDSVFTPSEIRSFTIAEAFVLGCAFYIHDLGMAFAATAEGRQSLEQTAAYCRCYERLASVSSLDSRHAQAVALQVSAREMHAVHAETLIDRMLPGLDRYLLESKDLRDHWGDHIGKIAASHHWTLREVDTQLGSAGRVPAPHGQTIDLGFLACALRIIDYAHINAARAPQLDRLLRADIPDESLVHWLAQEFISGPTRDGEYLAYASMRPVKDVDAWWVFYEMATGLDREITAVADYLAERTASFGRFSLEGVKGVKTPTSFARYIRPGAFSPVDVRFRPDSMTRLVDLLGGKQLYGNDRFAPLRELLQNARDAIQLQRTVERTSGQEPRLGQIDVRLEPLSQGLRLSVSDDGVGMSARTVTSYLLGIASDFWHSPDFYNDYPNAATSGFTSVGRFGIGFLSVFMIGDDVEVETQRVAGANLSLKLRGVGKRGALQERPSALRTGTTVRIRVSEDRQGDFEGLARIVQAKAPMLDIPIRIGEMDTTAHVEPGWWQRVSQEELSEFLARREITATMPAREVRRASRQHVYDRRFAPLISLRHISNTEKWPGKQPEVMTDKCRVFATPGRGSITLCSKGFAIRELHLAGLTGLAEVDEVDVNAARSLPIGFDEEAFRGDLLRQLWPAIVAATDKLLDEGPVPTRFSFLNTAAKTFGEALLSETSLPWIGRQHPSGSSSLISSSDLSNVAAATNEIFIAYGTGPWGADYWVRSFHPDAGNGYVLIVVPTGGGPSVRSRYGQERGRIDAPLPAHFVPDHSEDEEAESQLSNAHLLNSVLATVANTWGVAADSLHEASWTRSQSNLIGRLRAN